MYLSSRLVRDSLVASGKKKKCGRVRVWKRGGGGGGCCKHERHAHDFNECLVAVHQALRLVAVRVVAEDSLGNNQPLALVGGRSKELSRGLLQAGPSLPAGMARREG